MLVKVKSTVTYKVPAWEYCNHNKGINISSEKCRFCVKNGAKGYTCALYNSTLTTDGAAVHKTCECVRATAGFASNIEAETPSVDPTQLTKLVIAEYNKIRKQLLNQGYPVSLVDKLATEYILGGNK